MIQRCINPNHPQYHHYGGRGISVCDSWLDAEGFLSDMGRRPSPKHSLDRIDNDGDYTPENCRWATQSQQMNNTRANHTLTHNDQTKTITEWAKDIGIEPNTLEYRIIRGWSVDRALTAAPQKKTKRLITYKGETKTPAEWAKVLGISKKTIFTRIYRGWSDKEIIETDPSDYIGKSIRGEHL